jgi:hypothetical protein
MIRPHPTKSVALTVKQVQKRHHRNAGTSCREVLANFSSSYPDSNLPGRSLSLTRDSMAGSPITKTDKPITKKTKQLPPNAKRKEQQQKVLIAACRRSGFDVFEILQILADLYGWQRIVITSAPGIREHTITNAWSQSKAEKNYRTGHGSP